MVMDAARLAACAARGEAELVEVFSSIQGEGPRVGERHLFVRFAHCDMHCAYCDTPLCHVFPAEAKIEATPGRRDFERRRNPFALEDLARLIERALGTTPHPCVSLTGGEPLLHPWAIAFLAPRIRAFFARVLLETDGNLPEVFATVREHVDIVSLDWKLPSATGEAPRFLEHRRFLELSRGLETWVKLVYVAETPIDEIVTAARAVAEIRPEIPFVLQPCTAFRNVKKPPPPDLAIRFQEAAQAHLRDVRVIPQVHRLLGQP